MLFTSCRACGWRGASKQRIYGEGGDRREGRGEREERFDIHVVSRGRKSKDGKKKRKRRGEGRVEEGGG